MCKDSKNPNGLKTKNKNKMECSRLEMVGHDGLATKLVFIFGPVTYLLGSQCLYLLSSNGHDPSALRIK